MQVRTFARRMFCPAACCVATGSLAAEPVHLGANRELFVDRFLIEELDEARQVLHAPVARELAIEHDVDWEGNTSGYHTVFQDGDLYRMYYRGSHAGEDTVRRVHQEFTCYAESRDGIHWERPSLGLFEFNGSKDNNIVWAGIGAHNFAPFKDLNPACPPEARYKAVGGPRTGPGAWETATKELLAFQSPDGIHWQLMQEQGIITRGAFDSQNLAFWDAERERYVCFHRHFTRGVRAVMTSTSEDFLNWTDPVWLEYPADTPPEHLYTNQIVAYHRAPQIFLGFPKRFLPSRRIQGNRMEGLSDGVFMSSRDGLLFHRWTEAWIRPGLQRERWVNRNNMTAWGIVETAPAVPGQPRELSVYSTEGYYEGESCGIRRYSLRLDGFVSVQAPLAGGTLVTKPFTFAATENPRLAPAEKGPVVKAPTGEFEVREPTFLSLPETRKLGQGFTLAVKVRSVAAGHRRLFSAYDGGVIQPGDRELVFDAFFAGTSPQNDAIRFWFDGLQVVAKAGDVPDWPTLSRGGKPYHLAVTWQDGVGTLYLNGKPVAQAGEPGAGPAELRLGDLRFGEDYPPTSLANEPFLGFADDLLVLKRALSEPEIAALAQDGPRAVVRETEEGVWYRAEGDDPRTLADILGGTDLALPDTGVRWAETQLLLNASTSAAGAVRCEFQTPEGVPIPGFTLAECDELYGDGIELPVSWRGGESELKNLAGRVMRLKVELKDADLYAIRFGQPEIP